MEQALRDGPHVEGGSIGGQRQWGEATGDVLDGYVDAVGQIEKHLGRGSWCDTHLAGGGTTESDRIGNVSRCDYLERLFASYREERK